MFDPERPKKKLTVSQEEFEDNWNTAFKRNDKNVEKNRYKRGQKQKKKGD
jgi:hypothetical protein